MGILTMKNRKDVLNQIMQLRKQNDIGSVEMTFALYITNRAFDAYCRDGETGFEHIAYAEIMYDLKHDHGCMVTPEYIEYAMNYLRKFGLCRFVGIQTDTPDCTAYRGLPIVTIDTREYVTNMHEL